MFKESTSLSGYGTRTYRYPRMPEECTAKSNMIDFPDLHMGLSIIEGKRIMAERYRQIVGQRQYPDDNGQLAEQKAEKTAAIQTTTGPEKAL